MNLGIDTSTDLLIFTIFNDEGVIDHYQELCIRKQSEYANQVLADLFKENDLSVHDLEAVVVTRGPGSFTGVRIGMTIAKVITSMLGIRLYTLSSLQYYSGTKYQTCILDARSNKVYLGSYSDCGAFSEELRDNKFENHKNTITNLEGFKNQISDENFSENFLALKEYWQLEDSIKAEPKYMKQVI